MTARKAGRQGGLIVAKVGRYFFEDSSFSQTFEEWVAKHAPRLDPR